VARRDKAPSSEAARKYLDDAIRRHKESGGEKAVPKDAYDRALTRIAKTVTEFRALGKRA
jgi:hypothetical protein